MAQLPFATPACSARAGARWTTKNMSIMTACMCDVWATGCADPRHQLDYAGGDAQCEPVLRLSTYRGRCEGTVPIVQQRCGSCYRVTFRSCGPRGQERVWDVCVRKGSLRVGPGGGLTADIARMDVTVSGRHGGLCQCGLVSVRVEPFTACTTATIGLHAPSAAAVHSQHQLMHAKVARA
jgi:hypothetical protein